jgi:outer membrane receptor protein involved in Fe transport
MQRDDRWVAGAKFEREGAARWRERPLTWRWGGDLRADWIDNGLFRTTAGAIRSTIRSDDVEQTGAGAYGETHVHWNDWFRTRVGLRVDAVGAQVDSDRPENSDRESDTLWSPKLSLAFGPWSRTELYVNLGYGHHSNDARGATTRVDPVSAAPVEPADFLVRARGVDVGLRTTRVRGLHATASLFLLDLDSELIFVGDAGATEAGRPSRRTGIEITNHWTPAPWLSVDLDAARTRGRFTDDDPAGDRIPGGLESAVSAGATVQHARGYSGSMRWC